MTDIFLLLVLFTLLGFFIFSVSGIARLLKKEQSKDEWTKVIIFGALSLLFFVLFGLSL